MENAVRYDAPGLGAAAPTGFTSVRPGTAAAEVAAKQRGRTLAATGGDVTLATAGALLMLGAVVTRRRRLV
jgi:hypothetical protein